MTPALTLGRSIVPSLILALLFVAAAQAVMPAAQRATLGVVVQDVSFAHLDELGIPQGVSVRQVVPGSPAEQAGIEPNDVVIAMDGLPVYSAERLRWLVSRQAPGTTEKLKIQRGAEPNGTIMATLDGKEIAYPMPFHPRLGESGHPFWLDSPASWPEDMQSFLDMWRRNPWHDREAPEDSNPGSDTGTAL